MPRFATTFVLPLLIVSLLAGGRAIELAAQSPPDGSDMEQSVGASITVAPAGVRRYVPGKWATVAVNGLNKSDVDAEETIAVMVGDDSNRQFARRVWVPARSRRQSWMPIRIPKIDNAEQLQVPMTSIHLKKSIDGGEQYQASVVGMTTSQRSLLLSWERSRTAVMLDQIGQDRSRDAVIEQMVETVYAGRDSVFMSSQDLGLVRLGGGFLPPSAKALEALDQIVIGGDLVLQDTVAAARIRDWLMSGGKLWIMVDQVSEDSVRTLLGDAVCYSEMNRVELNDFEIQQAPDHFTAVSFDADTWSSETPVDFVRVIVDTDDVQSYIDGWPAAFWRPVGHGEVLFTTLGARGWIRDEKPLPTYKRLSDRIFEPSLTAPRYAENMIPFLNDEIGYTIPGRVTIASILGAHMLVVLAAGAWLASRRRLHRLAAVIPVAALLASGSLVAIGARKTSAVPSMIATGQIARAVPDSPEVQVESVAAVYSQQERTLKIESSPETTTQLRDAGASGEIRRLLWDDRGDSNWLFVKQPPGVVRHVESESSISVTRPWNVFGKFTEQGFQGRIDGLDASRCQDAVIVSRASPALAANLQPDSGGRFVSGVDQVLAPDQFIDEKLLSDIQRDRQELIRRLNSLETSIFDSQPLLLVWTDPIDSGVKFDDDLARRGSTMALLPIRLQRLSSGSKFQVPASFVRLSTKSSMAFNENTGRWLSELIKPITSELTCVIPKALLPCQLSRAIVVIKINAPSRSVEIQCKVDGQYATIHSQQNPTGELRFEIDRLDALQLDANGELPLKIAVTPTAEELEEAQKPVDEDKPKKLNRSVWEIDYVHVHVEGTTL